MAAGNDASAHRAAIMIEFHVQKSRTNTRHAAITSLGKRIPWNPAEQSGAEGGEPRRHQDLSEREQERRYRQRQYAPAKTNTAREPGRAWVSKGTGRGRRHCGKPAADPSPARQSLGIGLAKALKHPQHEHERRYADEDRRHGGYLICASKRTAPAFCRRDRSLKALSPPAA